MAGWTATHAPHIFFEDLYIDLFSQVLFGQVGGQDTKDVSYQCNKISFPGRTLTTTSDDNIYGPTREIVDGFEYGNVDASFYCHNDFREKKFFETWQRLAFNTQTWAVNYYDDYVGTIQIYSLDAQNNRRYGCELVECFPKSIAAQGLDSSPATASKIPKKNNILGNSIFDNDR